MQGTLMPIGGAEDKRGACTILNHFVQCSGSSSAHLVVIPSASSFPQEVAQDYTRIFTALGAQQVSILHIPDRRYADHAANLGVLNEATGIFLSGGDQLRLMSLIGGTRLAEALRSRFWNGVNIAGTSAGASIMSRQMIGFGRSGDTPSQRMVQMALGLGLTDNLIIDQHFRQRRRLGRLMTAVALNPGLTGVGVDENTALEIHPDGAWQVIGAGGVTIVDSSGLEYSDIYAAKRHDPLTLRGMEVRVLLGGEQVMSLPSPSLRSA
ncbi:MAG: cyanophycinase [bacterium]|nr:cyanophycinase [bacterium]